MPDNTLDRPIDTIEIAVGKKESEEQDTIKYGNNNPF